MSSFLHHLQNMSEEDITRLPEDVYKKYVKEKADRIVQEVVPESTVEVEDCLGRIGGQPQGVIPVSTEVYLNDGTFPKQSTLYPLAKVS